MKTYRLGILLGVGILCGGCGPKDGRAQVIPEDEDVCREEITLMHTDADKEEFRQYIEEAEKKLARHSSNRRSLVPSGVILLYFFITTYRFSSKCMRDSPLRFSVLI